MSWEAVIGLEVHVQLATETKAFSASAIRFGAEPNSQTDPTVLGLPGALPVFNARALELAVRLGVAVGGDVRRVSHFARKQYFYPDLPKGYQISQYDEPLIVGGHIELTLAGESRTVALTRIHLEEDAGKSSHRGRHSLVDLNRAGVPLCEVVSEPVIRSASEAAEYMRALRRLVRVLGVSDADMEKGQLRCDANVSIRRPGDERLGTRTELKNINSFKFVEAAIEHEIARQIRVLEDGGTLVQETRLWDADRGVSASMRGKEEALDYRYFPDPDLPPLEVTDALLSRIRDELPELPEARRRRYRALGLSDDDAATLIEDLELSVLFDATLERGAADAKLIANWVLGEVLRAGAHTGDGAIAAEALAGLLARIADDTISGTAGKKVFDHIRKTGESADQAIETLGLRQISDAGALEAMAAEVIAANPEQAAQYRGGKDKLLGFFVGQLMKRTQGKANPQLAGEVLQRLLSRS